MKCKVGDMALIVKSMAGNEGKVVTCLEYMGHDPGIIIWEDKVINLTNAKDWWRIDVKLNMLQIYNDGTVVLEENHSPFCRDDFLMPIGNRDAPMEVKEDEKLPSAVPV